MSTEARRAWIDVKRSATSAAASGDGGGRPETGSPSRADGATSGSGGGRRATANDRVARHDRRRRTTHETAYNEFKAGSSGLDDARVNDARTHRAQRRGDGGRASRAVGNFRITSAAYDSRFVDMAVAEPRRQTHDRVTGDEQQDDVDYDEKDDDDAAVRAASVAKCLLWLRRQHCP